MFSGSRSGYEFRLLGRSTCRYLTCTMGEIPVQVGSNRSPHEQFQKHLAYAGRMGRRPRELATTPFIEGYFERSALRRGFSGSL